jgi:hypothetical protein
MTASGAAEVHTRLGTLQPGRMADNTGRSSRPTTVSVRIKCRVAADVRRRSPACNISAVASRRDTLRIR